MLVTRGWREESPGAGALGTEFQLCKMKELWTRMLVTVAHDVNVLNATEWTLQNG